MPICVSVSKYQSPFWELNSYILGGSCAQRGITVPKTKKANNSNNSGDNNKKEDKSHHKIGENRRVMCRESNMHDASLPIYNPNDDENDGEAVVAQGELKSTPDDDYRYYPTARRIPAFLVSISAVSIAALRETRVPGMSLTAKRVAALGITLVLGSSLLLSSPLDFHSSVRLAIIGNSLVYYNDLPRLLEAMAQGRLKQDSCLHGNADFSSHLWYGNGMYSKWQTGRARVADTEEQIFDFGACTVQELLFGEDERLGEVWASNTTNETSVAKTAWEYELVDDRSNPCLMDKSYMEYREARFLEQGRPQWDFVLMNDNTRSPCCTEQRNSSMKLLADVYLPWFKEIEATPIFMVTYSYWASQRDMSGLIDIPTFASLTYNGYLEYFQLAQDYLPSHLKPRMAPVGLAFLLVWEENPTIWKQLMHYDEIHLSPSGTFLEACVVYHTIFGMLPDPSVYGGPEGPEYLWKYARRMDPVEDVYKAFPTRQIADYLYHIAVRICVRKEIPRSLEFYATDTSVNFIPDDPIQHHGRALW